MKKQFFRVKQLADQTFSRAEKTDVLSDDLQEADRKVEYIKNSCQNVGKKLSACLLLGQLQGESGTKDKLMKKCPSYQLGMTMLECGTVCDDESLLKIVLNKCGHAEKTLSEENVEHDHRVEQHVLAPLQSVLETEIPNIVKQKRNLTKMCLDMDSAKARYHQAQKHSSNNTAVAAKAESIRDELKDSEQKVEQNRDVLACELFHLAARESELCFTILQYYKYQKHFHEYALKILDELVPELENEICSSKIKPVYGIGLEEHLEVTGRKIAFPIELCVCALLELGIEEEGLFRLAGGASKVKRMKLSFDAGCMTLATALSYRDPHVIAGALKSYLRELPEPLLTHSLYNEWLNAAKAQTHPDNKLQALWTVVRKLPQANFDNLSYLIKFFHVLSRSHEINKMSSHNIAIVIAPSLIWTKEENTGSAFGLNANVSLYPSIIDLLVTYADWFFDKEMEFYLTLEPVLNGDVDEKNSEKGIENRGFDLKAVDKMHKSAIEKGSGQNHPGGDADSSLSDIKRSQSISSLSEEIPTYESPKPITRRKNKSVAPVPPIFKDDKKKEGARVVKENSQFVKMKEQHLISDRPDKPPRPLVTSNSTLPRPSKNNRENKSTETNAEDMMLQSTDDMVILRKPLDECVEKPIRKDLVRRTTTISTNTDSVKEFKDGYPTNSLERRSERPVAAPRTVSMTVEMSDKLKAESESKPIEYSKVNLISVKKEWLLGKDSADIESIQLRKPAVPERPSTLKPHNFKLNRSFMDVTLRNNYENVSLSSNENLSTGSLDDKTLQKTQMYSIEKQQVAIIDVGNQDKVKTDKNLECTPKEVLNNGKDEVEKNLPEKTGDGDRDNDCNEAVASTNERKISGSRPVSLPGAEKPERPPKPDYKITSISSHTRAFSDGQIIDVKSSDNTSNNNNIKTDNDRSGSSNVCIKNVFNNNVPLENNELSPSSSLPISSATIKHTQNLSVPPPVPAKPRANSQSESTDF